MWGACALSLITRTGAAASVHRCISGENRARADFEGIEINFAGVPCIASECVRRGFNEFANYCQLPSEYAE
jgi:hypothetical protein